MQSPDSIFKMAAPVKMASAALTKDRKISRWRKTEIAEVKNKAKEFLSDRRKANNVLEIIAVLETEDSAIAMAAMHSLCTIFSTIIGRGEITSQFTKMIYEEEEEEEEKKDKEDDDDDEELDKLAEEKYRSWLSHHYAETITKMLTFIKSNQKDLQQISLTCLLKFVEAESRRGPKFPEKLLQSILLALLSSSRDTKQLLLRYTEVLQFEDAKFHTLQIISKRLKTHAKSQNDIFLSNCFVILERVELSCDDDSVAHKQDSEDSKLRNAFAKAWLSFLSQRLNGSLHRRVLVILHEKVMPHLEFPLLLTDFLLDSYKIGGPISLLALNGIFILMQKHNLELPDFYRKLYALFEPGIFYTKYRARFFYLANIFLSSTHLPVYLVAAFVKRLARLSLAAPPYCLKLVIPFIRNLLVRHPSLDKMLHNPDGPQSWSSDPYIMSETNPAECKALDSSLWELLTLRQHYYPGVSMAASMVEKQLPNLESDLSDLFELDMSNLIEGETKRHKKDTVSVNFERPTGFFSSKGNMKELWTF